MNFYGATREFSELGDDNEYLNKGNVCLSSFTFNKFLTQYYSGIYESWYSLSDSSLRRLSMKGLLSDIRWRFIILGPVYCVCTCMYILVHLYAVLTG